MGDHLEEDVSQGGIDVGRMERLLGDGRDGCCEEWNYLQGA